MIKVIHTEFGIHMVLVRLIKTYLNETCSKVCIGKYLSDAFPIPNGLKQGDNLLSLLFNCPLGYAIRLELIGKHKLLVYADNLIMICPVF